MKKIFQNAIILVVIFATMFGAPENARSLENNSLTSAAGAAIPAQQVVVYAEQSVPYSNFNAAIFAQGQLKYVPQLPSGSEVALYLDANKVNGPVGLQTGTRCSATQAKASYYQNTITMDGRFCFDFNNAILNKKSVYGLIPTEAVFLHKTNGERCSAKGNGGAVYLTNPASKFYRNYLAKRTAQKLAQLKVNTVFLDDLRVGWGDITWYCGGRPKEYASLSSYLVQMVGLAQYVAVNLPAYKIEGNLASPSSDWDKFASFDGAMCENCFTNWDGSWLSPSRMLLDLSIMDKWVKSGRKLYVISLAPDLSAASNRFAFAASLLIANNKKVYFHFGENYDEFYPIPEYKYALGLPTAGYVCNGYVCTRKFQNGKVVVDFGARKGSIILNGTSSAEAVVPVVTLSATAPVESPTAMTVFPTATLDIPSETPTPATIVVEPTQVLPSPEPTQTMEATATETIVPTETPVPTMISPTPTAEFSIPLETPVPAVP